MDIATILDELNRIEKLTALPSAYYVNADDYAMLLAATAPKVPEWVVQELREFERGGMPPAMCLDGVRLIPSKHVPRGGIVPVEPFGIAE